RACLRAVDMPNSDHAKQPSVTIAVGERHAAICQINAAIVKSAEGLNTRGVDEQTDKLSVLALVVIGHSAELAGLVARAMQLLISPCIGEARVSLRMPQLQQVLLRIEATASSSSAR